jgi:hypothetical protein
MAAPSKQTLLHAYRALSRAALVAVRHSAPSRHVLRARLRRAFRAADPSAYDARRVANTLLFLRAAAADAGAEHRALKALCHVWWLEDLHWRRRGARLRQIAAAARGGGGGAEGEEEEEEEVPLLGAMAVHQAYDQFYFTLRMLNETMGLSLR